MPTIFSRIISGELPGRFVWRDPSVVAFLSIEPMRPGHVLVVPREEVDHWIDLDPELAGHLFVVAQQIGKAQRLEWNPLRAGAPSSAKRCRTCTSTSCRSTRPASCRLRGSTAHPPEALDGGRTHPRAVARARAHRGRRLEPAQIPPWP